MRVLLSAIMLLAVLCPSTYAQDANSANGKLSGFTAGPYLLEVTTDSAVVAFHLDTAFAAKVNVLDGNEVREFKSEQHADQGDSPDVVGLENGEFLHPVQEHR